MGNRLRPIRNVGVLAEEVTLWSAMAKIPRRNRRLLNPPPASKRRFHPSKQTTAPGNALTDTAFGRQSHGLHEMRSAKAVVAENASRQDPAAMSRGQANGAMAQDHHRSPSRTLTGLRRWSIINRSLPGESCRSCLRDIQWMWSC